jgi:hypothetical protein
MRCQRKIREGPLRQGDEAKVDNGEALKTAAEGPWRGYIHEFLYEGVD